MTLTSQTWKALSRLRKFTYYTLHAFPWRWATQGPDGERGGRPPHRWSPAGTPTAGEGTVTAWAALLRLPPPTPLSLTQCN